MIKTIFLDLDDTILDFQKGERQAISKTLAKIGIEPTEKIIERYMEINIASWRALERGEMTRDQVLYGRFEKLLSELSVEGDPVETQKIYQTLLSMEHDFLPGGEELLKKLTESGKYKLYIATNGIPEVQKPRIADSGIGKYFDGVFISYDFGVGKPSREFFDRCFERIKGFRREECIIVGDSLTSDIKGGINAGILTCHFNPKDKPYDDIIPDYKIKELSELIPLLDSIE